MTKQPIIPTEYEDLLDLTPELPFRITHAAALEILRASMSDRETFLKNNTRIFECLGKIEEKAPSQDIIRKCYADYEDLFETIQVLAEDWSLTWNPATNQYIAE